MWIELPPLWIATLNVVLLPALQWGLAWSFTRMPAAWFEPPAWASRGDATAFGKRFHVKRWKHLLPDGASWFAGGFAKASLESTEPAYLKRFVAETWRGELCHASMLALVPVFFLWNPWWGDIVIVLYALAANLPCMIVQHINRLRLLELLRRRVIRRS